MFLPIDTVYLNPVSVYIHVAQLHHVVLACRPILYTSIGLHSAMHCFIEFKHVRDLWTEFLAFSALSDSFGGIC